MPWVIVGYRKDPDGSGMIPIRKWVAAPAKKKKKKRASQNNDARRRAAALARQRAAKARAEARARARRAAARARARRQAALARQRAKRAADQRRAAEAARIKREQQELYQQKVAAAKRTAYENLKQRQGDLVRRNGLVKDPKADAGGGRSARQALTASTQRAQRIAAEQKAQKMAEWQAEQARKASIKRLSGGNITHNGQRRAGVYDPQRQSGVKTKADATQVEKLINQEIERAKRGRGSSPEDIKNLQDKYEKYAGGVYETYKADVAKLNALLNKAKKGDAAAYKAAQKLYYGKFAKSQKEFQRLFGDGSNPLKDGAYGKLYQQLEQLSLAQREWWKRQMKASLQQEMNRLRRAAKGEDRKPAEDAIDDLQKQMDMFNEKPGSTGQIIDHYETWTGKDGKEHSRPVYRAATLEEALEAQRAKLIVEQQRAWNQQREQMVKIKTALMREGRLNEGLQGEAMLTEDGRVVDRQTLEFEADLFKAREEIWNGKMPEIKNDQDLQNIANDLVRRWEQKNPRPAGRGPTRQAYLQWEQERLAYERKVYAYLGSDTPDFLRRVMTAPGVSHGLAILQGGTSAIGGIGRVINTAIFDESTIGGVAPTMDQLPTYLKRQRDAYVKAHMGGSIYGETSHNALTLRWWNDFLRTPEGKKWYAATYAANKAQDDRERNEFAGSFYKDGNGNYGDPAGMLEALNKFGSEPFQSGELNLLFQLLVDPTNAIPLKFTTYAARGMYAAGLAKGANKVSPKTWFTSAKNFLAVDEGTLTLQRALRKFDKELRAKGTNFEDAADELRASLVGAKNASEMSKRYEEFARKYGLDPREISESGVGNLTELKVTDSLREKGGNMFSQGDQTKAFAEADAAVKAADKARREAEQAKNRAKVRASTDEALDRGRAAEERLAIRRTEHTEALKSQADEVAGPRAAAAEPASGKPVPPAKPKAETGGTTASQPGPVEPALAKVHEKTFPRKRRTYQAYESYNEHYTKDRFGNVVPKDPVVRSEIERLPEYRAALKKAQAGDEAAMAEVATFAQQMGHVWRTRVEDAGSVKTSKFTPTPYDIAVRAGIWGDEEATKIVMKNRETLREVQRAAARGNKDYAASFVQKNVDDDEVFTRAEPIQRLDIDQDAAEGFDYSYIGEAVLEGNVPGTFRQSRDLYQPFTHRVMPLYSKLAGTWQKLATPGWVSDTLTLKQFGSFVHAFDGGGKSGARTGPRVWRDTGFALFEMFHQLRLAGNYEKLKVFSAYMDSVLEADPTSISALMWKVMEVRASLPWAGVEEMVNQQFLVAAKAFDLDPYLALSSIPNGYRAQRPPRTFDLSPRLRPLGDSDDFLPAPAHWNERVARDTITSIFTRSVGEPMQVVHYAAKRFGDFVKGTPLMNRITGEMGFQLLKLVGEDEMVKIIREHIVPGSDLAVFAARRGADPEEFIRREIANGVRKFSKGSTKGQLRPDYPGLREAIIQAYWAGDIPVKNQRVHELMYLARLQDRGALKDAFDGPTITFQKYMRAIGRVEEGAEFLRKVNAKTIEELNGKYAALGGTRQAADSLMSTRQWRMWQEMGWKPDDKRLLGHRTKLKKIRQQANEYEADQMKRQDWVARESEKPSDAYTGVVSKEMMDELALQVEQAENLDELVTPLTNLIRRIADRGGLMGSADDVMEGVSAMVKKVKSMEGGDEWLAGMVDEIGSGMLDEALFTAGEKLAWYEAALRIQLKTLQDGGRPITKGKEAEHTQVQLALQRTVEMRRGGRSFETANPKGMDEPKLTVKAGPSHRIDLDKMREELSQPVPEPQPNPVSEAYQAGNSELLKRISGMTDEQYWRYLKQRAYKVLKSKTATAEKKAAARQVIHEVELAEYARQIDQMRGTRIGWHQRADHREKVLKEFGKDAEEYISPSLIAPYARDAYGAAVERTRTWWKQLRAAPAQNAQSRTRGLGPKRTEDYFPIELFEEVEQEVAAAIREARGWGAKNLTRKRGSRAELQEIQMQAQAARYADRDPKIIEAKRKVLAKYGIDMAAYDEARKILWKGYIQKRTNEWLIARADAIVDKAKQLGVKDPEWDKAYLDVRRQAASQEARRQLGNLAFGEFYGLEPQAIFDEFHARYSDDGTLRRTAHPLSDFQRRTLQEAIKHEVGIDKLDEPGALAQYLQSANMPPQLVQKPGGPPPSRTATRDWLVKRGMWSPRKAEDFRAGKQSWSVEDEADYWRTTFGVVPEWADTKLLAGDKNGIFHHEQMYFEQMREWGIFNRSDDLKARLAGEDAKTIEERALKGDPATNRAARREIAEQRRYAMERYGDLVTDDGVTLKAMPWLMTEGEMRTYLAKQPLEQGIPGLAQNADELNELVRMIEEEMEPLVNKLLDEKQAAVRAAGGKGEPITFEDIYHISAQVQARLLADPKWMKRGRDRLGKGLDVWSGFNRWLIFSNPAFLIMNVIDSPIKGGWYRFTRRGLFNPGLHEVPEDVVDGARSMGAAHFGLDHQTTLYAEKQMKAADHWKNPKNKGILGALERGSALFRYIPETAGRAEVAMKVRLAQGMYPQVYAEALAKFGDEDLADAWARTFIKDEVNRMWPVVGNDPVEKLFNRLVPFLSYSIKNKLLFLSEALGHPSVLNKIDYIGRYIEEHNLKDWEKDHPNEEMPEHLRRRIELPWAPDYYLDLGQFSDATRGLKPLYNMGEETTVLDYASSWVRIVNPGAQAGIYMITNAIGLTRRMLYVPVLDANGFPTGQYKLVEVGWTEPWSDEQPDPTSIFWFLDAAKSALEYGADGFTAGELSQALGQVFLFNAIKTYDRDTAVFGFYKMMLGQNKEIARLWLENTQQGLRLQAWMTEQMGNPREAMDTLRDLERAMNENPWFKLSADEQAQITGARDQIRSIREVYAARLASAKYGSAEYRTLKAEMYYLINEVYLKNPALIKNEVWSKTPAQWAAQLEEWQTDKLMDDFMALSNRRPARADFKSSAAYNKAVEEWEKAKRLFLKTYPQVEKAFAGGIAQLDAVRDRMQADWDAVLSRISQRNEQIDAAKRIIAQAGRDSAAGEAAQDRLDILYIQNDLDFSLLEKDYAAEYFQREDFQKLPFGVQGPTQLQRGISLPRFTVLNDFDRTRYEKALREGRLDEFLAKEQYGKDMKAAILYAKGGDVFGEFDGKRFFDYMNSHPKLRTKYFANNPGKENQWQRSSRYVEGIRNAIAAAEKGGGLAFVKYLKAHPWLMEEYFKRHPEKRAQWAQNDAYIKQISRWGRLVGAGQWDAANDVWDSLPQWVKDRYYAKHPERRQRAAQTSQYLGYMKKWISLFDKGDKEGAMRYFNSLPKWAKDRYFQKHPEKRAEFETSAAMFDKARKYFAADKNAQTKFLKDNQDFASWLAKNGSSEEQERFAILAAYRSIPKEEAWLRRIFREKYPEVFSAEALGERKLQKVFGSLSRHPELSDDFEKWVETIWKSYEEMLRLGKPRPLSSYFHTERNVPARKFIKSLSATQSSR